MTNIVTSQEDINLYDSIIDYFTENKHLIIEINGIDITEYSNRAIIDQIEITDVNIDKNNKVSVPFKIDYSVYYGCEDLNVADTICEEINGQFIGGDLIFQKAPIKEKRSTYEEF